jgi:hypothetical protein
MEKAFPLFLSREIVVCVSALVMSHEWNRLPDVISRDCMFSRACHLTRMEQASSCLYLGRLYYVFPLLLSHQNGLGPPAVFISRDCSMCSRFCYLTRLEQSFQLLSHHIEVQISALAASSLRECLAMPFRITAFSYHQGQVVGTLRSFETYITGYQSTRCNNPDNLIFSNTERRH